MTARSACAPPVVRRNFYNFDGAKANLRQLPVVLMTAAALESRIVSRDFDDVRGTDAQSRKRWTKGNHRLQTLSAPSLAAIFDDVGGTEANLHQRQAIVEDCLQCSGAPIFSRDLGNVSGSNCTVTAST